MSPTQGIEFIFISVLVLHTHKEQQNVFHIPYDHKSKKMSLNKSNKYLGPTR